MKKQIQYIMKDQTTRTVDNIMQCDLTWRQKKVNTSMHFSIVAGLTVVSFISQIL